MTIRKEVLDELIGELKNPEEFYGRGGLIEALMKAITERVLEGELTHLGHPKNAVAGNNSSFEPQLIEKHQIRFDALTRTSSHCMSGEWPREISRLNWRNFIVFRYLPALTDLVRIALTTCTNVVH